MTVPSPRSLIKFLNSSLEDLKTSLAEVKTRLALYDQSITRPTQAQAFFIFIFTGKISGSKVVKGVRTGMYKNAQTRCGYYHPSISAFTYHENDLSLCIVFKTEEKALTFQTEFEFLGTNIYHIQLETESEITHIGNIILGERIFLKDYVSHEFGLHPDG